MIIGTELFGLHIDESNETQTISHSLVLFPFKLEICSGTDRFYNELSFSVMPLFCISLSIPG